MKIDLNFATMKKPAKLTDLVGNVYVPKDDPGMGPYILARFEPDVYRLISLENGNRHNDYDLTVSDLMQFDDITHLIKVSIR